MKDAGTRMAKSVASLKQDLTKIRTGRAHTSLLDHITVEYYGSDVPIKQVANVAVEDGRFAGIVPLPDVPADARREVLGGGILAPGFVDLQVEHPDDPRLGGRCEPHD